jgi:SAM-dependent methyltransferase
MKHQMYHRAPARYMSKGELSRLVYKPGVLNYPGDQKFETPRANFINECVDYTGKRILDIGCNTGYFLFNALDRGAVHATGYEGAQGTFEELRRYVDRAEDDIQIFNEYFPFLDSGVRFDIAHLLNVVHHFGDDYGPNAFTLDQAKDEMLKQVNSLSTFCLTLIFQMGFNWHGKTDKPLFERGLKEELINFIEIGTRGSWQIEHIGVPELIDDKVVYCSLDNRNILRNNFLGEFLNRPLFVMRSLRNVS